VIAVAFNYLQDVKRRTVGGSQFELRSLPKVVVGTFLLSRTEEILRADCSLMTGDAAELETPNPTNRGIVEETMSQIQPHNERPAACGVPVATLTMK
jgi:hypothetical protein